MEARIKKLENEEPLENETIRSKENQNSNSVGLFSEKEAKLKISLDKFKKVTKDVRNLALSAKSDDEKNTVSQLTKILDVLTAKMSLDEIKISVDLAYGKGRKASVVENDIETMIDSLENVVDQLTDP